MSTILTLRYDFSVTAGGREVHIASPTPPATVTLDTEPSLVTYAIAADGTVVLWNPTLASTPAEQSDFKILILLTDVDVDIELTCNEGDADERVFAVRLAAGIPLVLGADDAYYNFTAGPAGDAFAGTLDVIDKIRALNTSSSDVAHVTRLIGS
jgi:hypothetical protein